MMNERRVCDCCGEEWYGYEHKGKFYCAICARGLLSQMKAEYFKSNDASLGWEIDELWRKIVFNPRSPEYSDSRLEDDSWMDEMENDDLKAEAILAYAHEDARELVQDFVAERLGGDLGKLKDFNLSSLENDEKYGQLPGNDFDADDCQLSRAIYVIVWGDKMPYLNMLSIGRGRSYRGDTMNTFNTVFGKEIEGNLGHFGGIEAYNPDEELRSRVRQFSRLCPTIGNYILLPNNSIKGIGTINTFRGCHEKWHDFFDQYLIGLERVLCNQQGQDETLRKFVKERNSLLFSRYSGREGFAHYVRDFYLEDYIRPDGHAADLFGNGEGDVLFHWRKPKLGNEEYCRRASNYLDKAIAVIDRRADKMIKAIEKNF